MKAPPSLGPPLPVAQLLHTARPIATYCSPNCYTLLAQLLSWLTISTQPCGLADHGHLARLLRTARPIVTYCSLIFISAHMLPENHVGLQITGISLDCYVCAAFLADRFSPMVTYCSLIFDWLTDSRQIASGMCCLMLAGRTQIESCGAWHVEVPSNASGSLTEHFCQYLI